MKALRNISILCILHVNLAYGQDFCKTNINEGYIDNITKGTIIERSLYSDSIQFELRFWICNYFLPDKMIQITQDKQGNWNYNLGYLRYNKKEKSFIFLDSLKKIIDWRIFETKLDSFLLAELPDQKSIDLTYIKDSEIKKIKSEEFFSGIYEGVLYTIEIYKNTDHVTISYHLPDIYLDRLRKLGLSTREHEIFLDFINYLKSNLNYTKLSEIQYQEETKSSANRVARPVNVTEGRREEPHTPL